MPFPTHPFHTSRLDLKPFETGDVEGLLRIYSRADVVRYLYTDVWTPLRARNEILSRSSGTRFDNGGDMHALAIVTKDDGQIVGDLLLFLRSEVHRTGEVGFVLHPAAQGLGYATEAAGAMLEIGFEHLNPHRIIGRCDARNTASARVLENIGMRREAHFLQDEYVKGEWTDTLVFAQLAAASNHKKGS